MSINESNNGLGSSLMFDFDDQDQNVNSKDNFSWTRKNKPKPKVRTEKPIQESFSYHPVTDINIDNNQKQEPLKPAKASQSVFDLQEPLFVEKDSKIIKSATFSGKDQSFKDQSFSGKDLTGADFSGADLTGTDFSGAILSNANFSGANLSGANLSGAILHNTNFYKAKMHNVILKSADLEEAVLLEADLDQLTIEDLQELIEFLAINFPHKVNLAKINLQSLDLSRIDLKNLNLRGVDFTGVDFTNINIFELDLSECIITPEQIAQALGHTPTPLELRQILAPKKRDKKKSSNGIDLTGLFFDDGKEFGVWDMTKNGTVTIDKLLETGKKVINKIAPKPKPNDMEIMDQFEKSRGQKPEKENSVEEKNNSDLRKAIEENKRMVLQQKKLKKIQEEYYSEVKDNTAKENGQSYDKQSFHEINQRGRDVR